MARTEGARKVICLVDDHLDEVTRFRKLLAKRFVVGAGTSIDAALADLPPGHKRPDLFLLDLYYSQQSADATSEAALRDARATFMRVRPSSRRNWMSLVSRLVAASQLRQNCDDSTVRAMFRSRSLPGRERWKMRLRRTKAERP
jgi:hypothetical protein